MQILAHGIGQQQHPDAVLAMPTADVSSCITTICTLLMPLKLNCSEFACLWLLASCSGSWLPLPLLELILNRVRDIHPGFLHHATAVGYHCRCWN
jgi:hypothetical protein